jgi:phosphocarrier protein HPr
VVEGTVEVRNRLGLHLRAAAALAKTVAKYKSIVTIGPAKNQTSARSVMGLMMLGASIGTKLKVRAEGDDAEAALAAVKSLFDQKFGED